MKIKRIFIFMTVISVLTACHSRHNRRPIIGTWELISSSSTQHDSTVSTYDPAFKMIKIINATHFAFFRQKMGTVKDSSTNGFTAGDGRYAQTDSNYTEYLDYYIDRQWENNKFAFVVKIVNDTLVQKGVEKVPGLGVDRVIDERYKRVKN